MNMNFIKNQQKYIIYGLLAILILFNVYLYRNELTVTSDPNDNNFHYALIDESKIIWKNIFSGKTSPFSIIDSWNERWAEGYPLSLYYSHLPQAVFSLISFVVPIPTFNFFVFLRTFLLVLLPVTFFIGTQIMGFSLPTALITAFFAQSVFTDGLYGIDATSYLWRGWGLTAQLLAVFFLPLAFAYSIDYLENKKNLGKAILFNFIVAQAHFGMLYLLLIAYPVYWLITSIHIIEGKTLLDILKTGKRVLTLVLLIFLSLSYFIIPFFLTSAYRNFSYWDPIWKFDSLGVTHILKLLLNGELFDFNRFPFMTLSVIFGLLLSLRSSNKLRQFLGVIFIVYFILYLGKDVLGPFIKIIPGLNEYHLHRVIVMVQFIGFMIAADLITNLFQNKHFVKNINKIPLLLGVMLIVGITIYQIEKPIIKYVKDNDAWIKVSNENFQKDIDSYEKIINTLKRLPKARVYAGRPGNWGNTFKIGDAQVYMALSKDGFSTIGFLPQSWSPNSDSEQFFDEGNIRHYELYNVGYLVFPSDRNQAPKFAKLVVKAGRYSLYRVKTDGWFGIGQTNLNVIAKKTDLLNIVHLWISSYPFLNKDYPSINRNKEKLLNNGWNDKMTDLNTYNENLNIYKINPFTKSEEFKVSMYNKQEKKINNGYQINFDLKEDCKNCIVFLRQTYHPFWKIYLNDKKISAFPVFPYFIGLPVDKAGNYKIEAIYQPSTIKYLLIFLSVIIFIIYFKKLRNNL
jgi:hypothetical protein